MESQNVASLSFKPLEVEHCMRHPDQEGPAGRAWLLRAADTPENSASLGTWLVNIPGAHAWWEWWVVGVVHLREEDHLPAPRFAYEGAEYEFTILTIDPEECPSPDPDLVDDGYSFLHPADVAEQFHGVSDGDAARITAKAISALVEGRISPDEDFRPAWKTLLEETVRAFKAGHYALN